MDTHKYVNSHYDEAFEMDGDSDISSEGSIESPTVAPVTSQSKFNPTNVQVTNDSEDDVSEEESEEESSEEESPVRAPPAKPATQQKPSSQQQLQQQQKELAKAAAQHAFESEEEEEEEENEEEDEDEFDEDGSDDDDEIQNAYDPSKYAKLDVNDDIRNLFRYIQDYKPHSAVLKNRMKPFVPEYIPAVGEVDAFIKVPRPDGKPEKLGLVQLDEPALVQSDPPVLEFQLRAQTKHVVSEPAHVHKIEYAAKKEKEVSKWIKTMGELRVNKPPPVVNYTRKMPSTESLMQVWPHDVGTHLAATNYDCLPTAALQSLDLTDFARLCCVLVDIPCSDPKIPPQQQTKNLQATAPPPLTHALHQLFTVYQEFAANEHFKAAAENEVNASGGYNFLQKELTV